jgi:hypothetical protein
MPRLTFTKCQLMVIVIVGDLLYVRLVRVLKSSAMYGVNS